MLSVTAENIESQNYRFTVESVYRKVIVLRLFKLKFHHRDCKEPFCGDRGAFRATSQECHKNLDMEDMFMPYIEQLSPINSLRSKCLESSGLGGKLMGGKSSLNNIREDMWVNEIIVCEPSLREREDRRKTQKF